MGGIAHARIDVWHPNVRCVIHQVPAKSADGWFAAAVKRAGVQPITPHDLRHTCASLAVSAGVNVLALQRMLGHASAKVTMDTYADLFDGDLDAVAATLHARYSRESALKMRSRGASQATPQTRT
jgi:integrase